MPTLVLLQTDERTQEQLTEELQPNIHVTRDPHHHANFGIWTTPPHTLKDITLTTRRIRARNPNFTGIVIAPTNDIPTRLKIAQANLTWVAPHELTDATHQIKTLLTNHPPPAPTTIIGNTTLDPQKRTVTVGSTTTQLTRTEYQVLHALVTNANNVVTYESLVATARLPASAGPENLKVFMSRIRARFANAGVSVDIVSERGVGYVWRFDVGD